MAMLRANKKDKSGVIQFMIAAKKLQKKLLMGRRSSSSTGYNYEDMNVPKGHFAVVAVEGEETKRFVVPLSYLNHPSFLKLLQLAAEEYGFDREGALALPCTPHQLETILANEQWV